MYLLLWDASALAQRYAPEVGHQTVNALFAAAQADDAPRAPLAQTIGPLPNLAAALIEVEHRFGS